MRLLLLLALLSGLGCSRSEAPPMVAAAASLRNAMPALIEGFGQPVAVTYGGSGTLRQQVEGGAPIDAVIFAAPDPVDDLISKGLADSSTRVRLATNDLVLITPSSSSAFTWNTLASLPPGEKLALGEPGAVPAGRYARLALIELGSWDGLQDRIVFAGDVGAVLAYARRGEVAVAAVYATDVRGIDDVVVVDRWTGSPKPEIVGAAIREDARARAFLQYVASPAGAAILSQFGFGPG